MKSRSGDVNSRLAATMAHCSSSAPETFFDAVRAWLSRKFTARVTITAQTITVANSTLRPLSGGSLHHTRIDSKAEPTMSKPKCSKKVSLRFIQLSTSKKPPSASRPMPVTCTVMMFQKLRRA